MTAFRTALAAWTRAVRAPGLVVALWLPHLLLALVVVDPVATRLGARLDANPESGAFLGAVPIDLLVELGRAESSLVAALGPLVTVVLLVALLLNPLLAGGALEVLLGDDRRPLLHRFGRGAGRFAGRLLRAGLAALVALLLLFLLILGPTSAVATRLAEGDGEIASTWLRFAGFAVAALAWLVVALGLDFARLKIVRGDRRDVVRCLGEGLGLVVRRPIRTLGAWALLGVVYLGVAVTLGSVGGLVGPASMLAIWLVAGLDQVVRLTRAGLRVALWSAEIEIEAESV